ncbi:MAG: efflux RND transporter periplasmic adaptor subunit [Alphaproteobacteria bacterium]|nr:efflux RND transporter periplasmic adaptor subunit [Alphaproteobacteria bacterium]
MSALIKTASYLSVAVILVVGGYRLGAGNWPTTTTVAELMTSSSPASETMVSPGAEKPANSPDRRILYWKDPTGRPAFASAPKQTADGQNYIPVHEDEEPLLAGETPTEPPKSASGATKKILYYRNPMGLPDTSPVPKKDWMGMDYIPVYEGEEEDDGSVKVSTAKIQRAGVRSEAATKRRLVRPVRAPGLAKPDERTLVSVALRADSFIEKLYVNETGRHVKAGEPLFRIYSPEMVRVQVDYRISANTNGWRDDKGAQQRLDNLQIPKRVLDELRRTREPVISFDWPAPATGVVTSKTAVEGMMMKAGDEMMRIVDLASIWVIADVAEQDIGKVRLGARAKVSFQAFPGEEFEGRVTFILHELEMATRTAKVRIEIANTDYRIKHEMFADVEIFSGEDEPERIVVPLSALIDSGNRQVVIVDRGKGRFEPRPVQVGRRGDDYVEIKEGIKPGENVVVAATFLIDAESNLKAALTSFGSPPPPTDAPSPDKKSASTPTSPTTDKPAAGAAFAAE